jgi:hypothetical protein
MHHHYSGMGYDSESGLVFDEVVKRRCDCFGDAVQRLRDSTFDATYPSRRGARTLTEMLQRRILSNLACLNAESLVGVPDDILKGLWERIDSAGLHTWAIFNKALGPLCKQKVFYWSWHCDGSCRQLPGIIRWSNNASWLTDITLDGRCVSGIELSLMPMLGNVCSIRVLQSGDCFVTDRVFGCWARAARDEAAFPSLKSIELRLAHRRNYEEGLTVRSLDRVSDFPALERLCLDKHASRPLRWTVSDDRYGGFVRAKGGMCFDCRLGSDPSLLRMEVMVGPAHIDQPERCDHAVCFLRDWSWQASPRHCISGSEKVSSKKRKVRHGKAFALNDMIMPG